MTEEAQHAETIDGIGERLVAALEPFVASVEVAKEALVALLKQLDEEVWQAEEDGADWPCGGDFILVAASLVPDDEAEVADRG